MTDMTSAAHEALPPLRVAVVGHTNTGKTSLMRTLMRDIGFGEISSRPSTTRHVEGARLMADGETLVELYDTPGLEAPVDLLEEIEKLSAGAAESGKRLDGPARIEAFLDSPLAATHFEQEAKVLRRLRDSEAGLYVIDARDPVLAKHRDELEILRSCAVPLLPVLNFVRDGRANENAWREALARLGLHAVVRFDTVAPERDGERRLYEKLATLLDGYRALLERLVESREQEARMRHMAALRVIAELLIDAAATRMDMEKGVDGETDDQQRRRIADALETLNRQVRKREQRCVDALLELYRFRRDDVDAAQLPLLDGRWKDDLFHPETLRLMGVKLGSGAAAGAAAGLGVDLMVGGITLGAAAALGALAGGGWQALRHFGARMIGRLSGRRSLSVDDAVLRLLALRQRYLLRALEARGHAAMTPIRQFADEQTGAWRDDKLPAPLARARAHPGWAGRSAGPLAGIFTAAAPADPQRDAAVDELAAYLAQSETPPAGKPA